MKTFRGVRAFLPHFSCFSDSCVLTVSSVMNHLDLRRSSLSHNSLRLNLASIFEYSLPILTCTIPPQSITTTIPQHGIGRPIVTLLVMSTLSRTHIGLMLLTLVQATSLSTAG